MENFDDGQHKPDSDKLKQMLEQLKTEQRGRAILDSIRNSDSIQETQVACHPLYSEGYADGQRDAHETYQKLTRALCEVYKVV